MGQSRRFRPRDAAPHWLELWPNSHSLRMGRSVKSEDMAVRGNTKTCHGPLGWLRERRREGCKVGFIKSAGRPERASILKVIQSVE